MRKLNRTYSVSELETFDESPERYREQYVLKRPSKPLFGKGHGLSATTRGDIIHKMIEYYGKGRSAQFPSPLNPPSIKGGGDQGKNADVFRERLFNNVRIELEINDITPEEKSDILEQFKNFLNSRFASAQPPMTEQSQTEQIAPSDFAPSWVVGNEVPFLMKINDDHVDGKLDMLIYNFPPPVPSTSLGAGKGGGARGKNSDYQWEIVDFKTGESFDPKESAKKYEFQMHAYALAVAKATGVSKGSVTLFFVTGGKGKEYKEEIDADKLKKTEKRIIRVLEGIKTDSLSLEGRGSERG